MAADGFGDRVVLGRQDSGLTAERVRAAACGGAAMLREQGAGALIYLDVNGPTFAVALFAAARAGIPLVPINYRLSAAQQAQLVAHHPRATILTGPEGTQLQVPDGTILTTTQWLAEATSRADTVPADGSVAESSSPAVVIYTSGTTAEPKGVLLRHDNLVSYVLGTVEFAGAEPGDTALVSVPPYHIAAVANVITNLYAGRRCIVLEQFTGEQWLELVRSESVTHALVVPTMLARIMSADADHSVPSLRSLAYGGAPMPTKVIEAALLAWPSVNFANAYGLTETSSTVAVLGPDEHRAAIGSDDPKQRARMSSVGRPVPGVEIEIRGTDGTGEALSPGQVGRIWVRGDQVSGEYAGAGSVLDPQGWFDTRDEGYLDEDGYLFVGGRTDDTIIRGGENIAPAEIEEAILALDGVDDAVVVGVPDLEWGQRLESAVVAAAGVTLDPEAIREHVRTQLRSSKTPDHIVVWDELPRTETGKIIRKRVLERMALDDASS
ncbi:fatty acid--CoA ligase family protein [Jatrophihabitans sp.]|uniref:class I adenylate-forming enzyme family protein n=1 Tax=Jatrophihabitans sp. TaxID=1932789 RepID=UPI0030C78383